MKVEQDPNLSPGAAQAAATYQQRHERGRARAWVGTPKRLFEELNISASDEIRRARNWPRSPAKLGEQVNRLTSELLEIGVHVERPPRTGRTGRQLQIFFVPLRKHDDTPDT